MRSPQDAIHQTADREQDRQTIADLREQVTAERECMRATARELGRVSALLTLALAREALHA